MNDSNDDFVIGFDWKKHTFVIYSQPLDEPQPFRHFNLGTHTVMRVTTAYCDMGPVEIRICLVPEMWVSEQVDFRRVHAKCYLARDGHQLGRRYSLSRDYDKHGPCVVHANRLLGAMLAYARSRGVSLHIRPIARD